MPEWTVKPGPEDTSTVIRPPESPARRPEKRGGRRRWAPAIGALALIAGGAFLYHQRQVADQEQQAKANQGYRPIPVTTAIARTGAMGTYVEALGTVTPVYTVTVTSRVQGQIMQVHYREGQMARKGDP